MTNPTPRIQKQQPASSMLCRNKCKYIQANKQLHNMNTKDLNNMNQFYESPSVRVIEIEGADIICTSDGTEQYTRNMDPDIF